MRMRNIIFYFYTNYLGEASKTRLSKVVNIANNYYKIKQTKPKKSVVFKVEIVFLNV